MSNVDLYAAADQPSFAKKQARLEERVINRIKQHFGVRIDTSDLAALSRGYGFPVNLEALKEAKPMSIMSLLDKPEKTPLYKAVKQLAEDYDWPYTNNDCGIAFSVKEKPMTLLVAVIGECRVPDASFSVVTEAVPVNELHNSRLTVMLLDAYLSLLNWEGPVV